MADIIMITLKPVGGLCNRMRAISSTYALASKMKRELHVIWSVNEELGASYNDLFVLNGKFEVTNLYPKYSIRDQLIEYVHTPPGKRIKRKVFKFFIKWKFDCVLHHSELLKGTDENLQLETMIHTANSVLLSTFNNYYQSQQHHHLIFEPIYSLSEDIKKNAEKLNSDTIGIHIRRTDNLLSIQHSKIDHFMQIMENEIKTNERTCFFLATDCLETQNYLLNRFHNRIIYREKEFSRTSTKGMHDAVIDLYLLAKTSKIIGSYYSSYSRTASILGGKQLIVVKG